MAQRKILCVASDHDVRRRRCLALIAEGYQVVGTAMIKHAAELLRGESFDLVLIGFLFDRDEKERLSSLARDKYRIPIVLLCGDQIDLTIAADCHIAAPVTDDALSDAIASLVRVAPAKSHNRTRAVAA